MNTRPSRRTPVLLAVAILIAVLTACAPPGTESSSPNGGANPATPVAPTLTFVPADGTDTVHPKDPVSVEATGGTLESVTMTNNEGRVVEGIFTPDRMAWKPGVPLGYGKTYTVTAAAVHDDGTRTERTSTFGIGIVIVTHFDEPITDRAAAEKALTVETTPPVAGSWYWADDQNVHWRPQNYWTPGTQVTVRANVYGIALGEGLFGQEDAQTSFTIGDAHISVADDTTKQITVTNNGEVVRTMPTSMGKGGSEVVAGKTISFWTQPGIYTVLDKANPVIMDSSTYGLPVNSRLGYKQTINYATRISTDGIYLHELADTIWAQGNTNVSHGCLNLSPENARWFYDFSRPGDIVEVRNTGGAPLELWQNGDWSVPWNQWQAGSALT